MEYIRDSSENEMVAIFLQAEMDSKRFGKFILKALEKLNIDKSIILDPQLNSRTENTQRNSILDEYRDYASRRGLFEDFPQDIQWKWVYLDRNDLCKVKYINYDYRVSISGGTRFAKDAALLIKQGKSVFNESNDQFFDLVKNIMQGYKPPPMILVARSQQSDVVVLEGHLRLTAYMMEPAYIPKKLKVLIGFSSSLVNRKLY